MLLLLEEPPPKTEVDCCEPKPELWPNSDPPDCANEGAAPNAEPAAAVALCPNRGCDAVVVVAKPELETAALPPPKMLPPEDAVEAVGLQMAWPKNDACVVAVAVVVAAVAACPNNEPPLPPKGAGVATAVDAGRAKLKGLAEAAEAVVVAVAAVVAEMEGRANEKLEAPPAAAPPPKMEVVLPGVAAVVAPPPNSDAPLPALLAGLAGLAAAPKMDPVELGALPAAAPPPKRDAAGLAAGVEEAAAAATTWKAAATAAAGAAALLAGVDAAVDAGVDAAGAPKRDCPNAGVVVAGEVAAGANSDATVLGVAEVAGAANNGAAAGAALAAVAAAELTAWAGTGVDGAVEGAVVLAEGAGGAAEVAAWEDCVDCVEGPKPMEGELGGAEVVAGDPNRDPPLAAVLVPPKRDVVLAWKVVPMPPKMAAAGLLVAVGAPPSPMPPKKDVVESAAAAVEGADTGAAVEDAAAVTGVMVREPPKKLVAVVPGVGSRPGLALEDMPPTTMTGLDAGVEVLGEDAAPSPAPAPAFETAEAAAGLAARLNENAVGWEAVFTSKPKALGAAADGLGAGPGPALFTRSLRADRESAPLTGVENEIGLGVADPAVMDGEVAPDFTWLPVPTACPKTATGVAGLLAAFASVLARFKASFLDEALDAASEGTANLKLEDIKPPVETVETAGD